MLCCADLAKRFGVPADNLRQRLKRWMKTHDDGWKEVNDRRPREPKYLYKVSAVMHIIEELQASGERPAK